MVGECAALDPVHDDGFLEFNLHKHVQYAFSLCTAWCLPLHRPLDKAGGFLTVR